MRIPKNTLSTLSHMKIIELEVQLGWLGFTLL